MSTTHHVIYKLLYVGSRSSCHNLYTTAIEGHLLYTISETDEDDSREAIGLEAIGPTIDECIPDSPTEGSEPFQNKS